MAKIRDLKKIVNNELSEVIEACYDWQYTNQKTADKAEAIIDEAIKSFDQFIEKINKPDVENYKKHFSDIKASLAETTSDLMTKLSNL